MLKSMEPRAYLLGTWVPGQGVAAVDEVVGQRLQLAGGVQHSVQGTRPNDHQVRAALPQQAPPQTENPVGFRVQSSQTQIWFAYRFSGGEGLNWPKLEV